MSSPKRKSGTATQQPSAHTARRRVLATAATLALTGTIAVPAAAAINGDAGSVFASLRPFSTSNMCAPGETPVNLMDQATPVGSTYGFTLFTKGDMILANQETEGSLAVGGKLYAANGTQYPILHQRGGNGNYVLPVIDGDATRILANQYSDKKSPSSNDPGNLLKIEAGVDGGIKLVDSTTPAGYSYDYEAGWGGVAFMNRANGNNGPMLMDVKVTDVSQTFATDQTAFTDYFPSNSSRYLPTFDGAGVPSAGYAQLAHPTDQNNPFVLDATKPTAVLYSEFSTSPGVASGKFKLLVPTNSTTASGYDYESDLTRKSFLVIKVTQADVTAANGVLNLPTFDGASTNATKALEIGRILWDLSDVTSPVSITSSEPVRGAIYAPNATVTIPNKEFEGQLIANSFVSTANNENHTALFSGALCVASGTSTSPAPSPTTTSPTPGTSTSPAPSPTTTSPTPGTSTTPAPSTSTTPSTGTGGNETTIEPGADQTTPVVDVAGQDEDREEVVVGGANTSGANSNDQGSDTTSTSGTGLADTGTAIAGALGAAAVLLAGGAGALTLRRRN